VIQASSAVRVPVTRYLCCGSSSYVNSRWWL